MRTSITKILAAVICTVAFSHSSNGANAKDNIPGVAEQPASYFYTGKPYDADLGSYTFNARNYNPEINRWISVDPSGFSDGANNTIFCSNMPLMGLDPTGLEFLCYAKGKLTVFSGAGKTSGNNIDWGDKGTQWAAVSGGAGNPAKPSIEAGWWQVGRRYGDNQLGGPDDATEAGEISEGDWQAGDAWHEGSMSVWNGTRAEGHTQYKYVLTPKDGQDGGGIKLHPDGPEIGVTHGCLGITGYDGAMSVDSYLQSHQGIKLYVE